ncbi:DUF3800 domain-containing protein [Leifsonia sp. 2MCAF36]|uniref:DUF3800 domain-containing protein n=1 Tax=Leifsonia sp. 2MCAF36 TaxID=3232988 RepID=UPI003F96A091
MLLAYIDEIGETGAFVSRTHERYNTSPAFGYAGFVIKAEHARYFGAIFNAEKQRLFKTEIAAAEHPGRWERKGASIFRLTTLDTFPQQIRVYSALVRKVRSLGGSLFYYADEKPLGTPKQTNLDTAARETAAMQETLNRLARHAQSNKMNLMVMIDQINERQRSERLPRMYSHILGRAADHPEMMKIIEPPMHVDSVLSANIQFADWVAACVTRAIEYQIIRDSPYEWVAASKALDAVRGAFTHESKLHLWTRSVDDFNHSEIFKCERPLYPAAQGQLLGAAVDPAKLRAIKAAAERAHIPRRPRM